MASRLLAAFMRRVDLSFVLHTTVATLCSNRGGIVIHSQSQSQRQHCVVPFADTKNAPPPSSNTFAFPVTSHLFLENYLLLEFMRDLHSGADRVLRRLLSPSSPSSPLLLRSKRYRWIIQLLPSMRHPLCLSMRHPQEKKLFDRFNISSLTSAAGAILPGRCVWSGDARFAAGTAVSLGAASSVVVAALLLIFLARLTVVRVLENLSEPIWNAASLCRW